MLLITLSCLIQMLPTCCIAYLVKLFTILEDAFIYKGVECLVCFMVGFQSKSFDTIKDDILAKERKKEYRMN